MSYVDWIYWAKRNFFYTQRLKANDTSHILIWDFAHFFLKYYIYYKKILITNNSTITYLQN